MDRSTGVLDLVVHHQLEVTLDLDMNRLDLH